MKRFFCFLIAILIFIINCVPVLATETEFVSGNFNTIPDSFLEDINLTIQEGHKYIYYFQAKNNSWEGPNHHIIYFDFPLEVEGVISESRITLTNSENSDSVIYWTRSLSGLDGQFYSGKTMSVGESFNIGLGLVVAPELLIYNGDCVSKNYCSEDVFVEMGSDDDYEEDGVIIKGLTSFFNKMTSGLNEIKETVLNIPKQIIQGIYDLFVPDIDNMKTSFNEFVVYLEDNFGYGPLIDTLKTMASFEGGSLAAGNVLEDFSIQVGEEKYNLTFSLPFSEMISDSAREDINNYIRGFFFILLILSNLSDIYFLIRGVSPWKSGGSGGSGGVNWHDISGGDM